MRTYSYWVMASVRRPADSYAAARLLREARVSGVVFAQDADAVGEGLLKQSDGFGQAAR